MHSCYLKSKIRRTSWLCVNLLRKNYDQDWNSVRQKFGFYQLWTREIYIFRQKDLFQTSSASYVRQNWGLIPKDSARIFFYKISNTFRTILNDFLWKKYFLRFQRRGQRNKHNCTYVHNLKILDMGSYLKLEYNIV